VSLEGAGWVGRIVVESGRITHASASPGETLMDSLAVAGLLGNDALRTLAASGRRDCRLDKVLVESGVLTRNGFAAAARRHTQRVISRRGGRGKRSFRNWVGCGGLHRSGGMF